MSEVEDLDSSIRDMRTLAAMQATSSLDQNPDDAAASFHLSKATGVPPTVVNADLPKFQEDYKAQLTGDVVRNNPTIAAYIQSHPLAAKVSNDDYSTLDELSAQMKAAGHFGARSIIPTVGSIPAMGVGASLGAQLGLLTGPAAPIATPILSIGGALVFGMGAGHVISKIQDKALESLGPDVLKDIGQDPETLAKEQQEFPLTTYVASLGPQALFLRPGGSMAERLLSSVFSGGVEAGTQYFTDGEVDMNKVAIATAFGSVLPNMTRTGHAMTNSVVNKFRAESNANAVEQLGEMVATAQKSTTRERVPELFESFLEQRLANQTLEIDGRRAAQLYGDRQPTPDDGILGFVPNIESQLDLARTTGANITVPHKDWIARVDPALHKELMDDLKVIPNGLTANEAKEIESVAERPMIDEALPQIKDNLGLEPLFSIGDRKLQIQRMAPVKDDFTSAIDRAAHNAGMNASYTSGFHDFDLVNEHGQKVGWINASIQDGGKGLYIDMVGGNGEYYNPNNFGPALMRDIARQLKAEFPETEYITGHRVSGARFKDGESRGIEIPKVRFAEFERDPQQAARFSELMHGAWADIDSYGIRGYAKNPDFWRGHETELVDRLHDEMARIAPKARFIPFSAIEYGKGHGIHGVFFPKYRFLDSLIGVSLNSPDQVGTLRHEIIHHLYRDGFFENNEWAALEKAAVDEGWIKRFNIKERYPKGDASLHLEEAIAEGYRQWQGEYDVRKRQQGFKDSPIDKIFLKLKDLFDSIKKVFADVLGREPKFEDIFQNIDKGEIGRREAGAGENRAGPAFQTEGPIDAGPGTDVIPPFRKAQDVGMTLAEHKKYMERVQAEQQANLKASADRILKAQKQRQSAEWKAQSAEMRQKVMDDLNGRPQIAADKFLGLGELYGEKLDKTYRLDWEKLTPEQRQSIPETYTVRKGGIDPDQAANLLGFQSGDEMIASLSTFDKARKASGLNRDRYMRSLIDIETQRRMEAEHGFLDKNVIEEAIDQITSENQLNLLHQETYKLALDSGEKGFDLTHEQVLTQLKDKFDNLQRSEVSSAKFLDNAGRTGRHVELNLLNGNYKDAFIGKQAQYYNMVLAKFAKEAEKIGAKLDKTAKRFEAREVKGVDQEYTNWIHDMLLRAGKPVKRGPQDLIDEIGRQESTTFAEFVQDKQERMLRDLHVPEFLTDPTFRKPLESMTMAEFKQYAKAIDAMVFNGRDEKKINLAGEKADYEDVRSQMLDKIKEVGPAKTITKPRTAWEHVVDKAKAYWWSSINLESIMNRIDKDDPRGLFNQAIVRQFTEASNYKDRLLREYQAKLSKLAKIEDMDKQVANDLWHDPYTQLPLAMTRRNVLGILQNAGEQTSRNKLFGGYKLNEAQGMEWIFQHTTKEDWDRAQAIGDVFNELHEMASTMSHSVSGVGIEKLDIQPIQTPFGTYKGWYNPVKYDPLNPGKSKKLLGPDVLEGEGFFRAIPPAGYTKARNGYIAPIELNLDIVPVRMKQMIHDIATRPAVIQLGKFFYDSTFKTAIIRHLGNHQAEGLIPFLRDFANVANFNSHAAQNATQAMEFFRQNAITTLVGMNPGTVMKHSFTAAVNSLAEVGPKDFAREFATLFGHDSITGQRNYEMAWSKSEELQRRLRNYQEIIQGHGTEIGLKGGKSNFQSLRDTMAFVGSMPVSFGDFASAVPTWLAKYKNGIAEGLTEGDAIFEADRAVRNAHGSSVITNRPEIARGSGLKSWFSSLYGFFSEMQQRQYKMAWKVADAKKDGTLLKEAPSLMAGLLSYVVMPAIIEELVSPYATTDKESWGKKAAKTLFYGASSSLIGVRDFIHGMASNRDPSAGLLSSVLNMPMDVYRDLTAKHWDTERKAALVKHTIVLTGLLTGLTHAQEGKIAEYTIRYLNGKEHPRDAFGVATGLRFGKGKGHSLSFDQWLHHMQGN